MRQNNARDLSWLLFPLAAALVVIGAKCCLIARYGNPTPFWDEWDAEGAFLFPKYFGGTLTFTDLIAPHNEHRILFTRLWSLLLLVLQGYWDPIAQMAANTFILGAMVALCVAVFRRVLPRPYWIVFAFAATLIFALPWTWGNSLWGFSSQWYFVLLFSLAGIVAIAQAPAFSARWWVAMLFLLCGYLSMSGGATAALAAFSICAVQMTVGARRGLRELSALLLIAAISAAMLLDIPHVTGHALFEAQSTWQFLKAFIEILSWPSATGITFVPTLIVLALVTYMPAWLASAETIMSRAPLFDRRWLMVGLTAWMMVEIAAFAYARSAASITERYLDAFAVGLAVNAGALLYLLAAHTNLWPRCRLVMTVIALWLLPVCAGTTLTLINHTRRDLAEARSRAQAETENVRAYLDTGDIRTLQNKRELEIPAGDPNHLAGILSQPLVRAILPPALVGEASAARAQQRGVARYTNYTMEAMKNGALRWGALLIPLGLVFFLVGIKRQREPKTA